MWPMAQPYPAWVRYVLQVYAYSSKTKLERLKEL